MVCVLTGGFSTCWESQPRKPAEVCCVLLFTVPSWLAPLAIFFHIPESTKIRRNITQAGSMHMGSQLTTLHLTHLSTSEIMCVTLFFQTLISYRVSLIEFYFCARYTNHSATGKFYHTWTSQSFHSFESTFDKPVNLSQGTYRACCPRSSACDNPWL